MKLLYKLEQTGISAIKDIELAEWDDQGTFYIKCSGQDPILLLPELQFDPLKSYLVVISAYADNNDWDIYWLTTTCGKYSIDNRTRFFVAPMGSKETTVLALPSGLCGQCLRLDPGSGEGISIIDSLEIYEIAEAASAKKPGIPDLSDFQFFLAFCKAIAPLSWRLAPFTRIMEFQDSVFFTFLDTNIPRENFTIVMRQCELANSANSGFLDVFPQVKVMPMPFIPPLPAEGESTDLIIAWNLFLDFDEDQALVWLQECHRLLKPGGLVVLKCYQKEFLKKCFQAISKDSIPADLINIAQVMGTNELRKEQYKLAEYIWQPLNQCGDQRAGVAVIPDQWFKSVWRDKFIFRTRVGLAGEMPANLVLLERI